MMSVCTASPTAGVARSKSILSNDRRCVEQVESAAASSIALLLANTARVPARWWCTPNPSAPRSAPRCGRVYQPPNSLQ